MLVRNCRFEREKPVTSSHLLKNQPHLPTWKTSHIFPPSEKPVTSSYRLKNQPNLPTLAKPAKSSHLSKTSQIFQHSMFAVHVGIHVHTHSHSRRSPFPCSLMLCMQKKTSYAVRDFEIHWCSLLWKLCQFQAKLLRHIPYLQRPPLSRVKLHDCVQAW